LPVSVFAGQQQIKVTLKKALQNKNGTVLETVAPGDKKEAQP
jgi:hypothetical protein